MSICINVSMIVLPVFLLFLFFMSIYMGSTFLSDHMTNDLSIPNTRNIIQKWSVSHLHGVDLTALGPPPATNRSGNGSRYTGMGNMGMGVGAVLGVGNFTKLTNYLRVHKD